MAYRIAILHQGFIPIYRVQFFTLLNEISEHEYVVFHGEPPEGSGHVPLSGPFHFPNVCVKNREIQIGSRTIVYQPVISPIVRGNFDALIIGHEFKFLANLLLFVIFKASHKPVILWGHGYHRRTAFVLARHFSSLLPRLADGYLAYSRRGGDLVRASGLPEQRITVVRNTIDVAREMAAHACLARADDAMIKKDLSLSPEAQTLLYIGRLSTHKRVHDLIEAVHLLTREGCIGPVELLVVGDGPEAPALRNRARDLKNVHFLGNVYDPVEVGKLMRVSIATVIPGGVGLAVNHSFAHGGL